MSSEAVLPLRIQKGNSPTKMNRPLSEVSPMAVRRNSPSFPQNKTNMFKGESSPFAPSPQSVNNASSPRLFWQGRDPASPARTNVQNRKPFEADPSPVPAKRSSLENLKKASRVKNSSMFAREQNNHYDPANPSILDRPLASGRPLNTQTQNTAFTLTGQDDLRKENQKPNVGTAVAAAQDLGPVLPASTSVAPLSPSKYSTSPVKSSLSKRTPRNTGFDPETGIWADEDPAEKILPEGRSLHRHAKSVTFDRAPPQVNEYEMTTPVPSSVASDSREGSFDSADEDDISFDRGSSLDRDESFDASLEDVEKTPVVMPEDWRFMSPGHSSNQLSQYEEDVFADRYGSPALNTQPGAMEYRSHQTSVNSVDSNGQIRPLPPLPSLQSGFNPSDSLSGTLERLSSPQRSLPTPPKAAGISKSDIRRMSAGSFSLEDRLRLMMLQEQEQSKPEPEKQRERRMRRADSKDTSPARETVLEYNASHSENGSPGPSIDESDEAPRISRDSILRHLRSQQDLNVEETSEEITETYYSHTSLNSFDPDVPIPSLEDPTQVIISKTVEREIVIKEEEVEETDLYSIPDLYNQPRSAGSEVEDDATSQYSQVSTPSNFNQPLEDGQETPRAVSPIQEPKKKPQFSERISLPDFKDFGEDSSFDLGLSSYMTPPIEQKLFDKPLPPMPSQPVYQESNTPREIPFRPSTPLEQLQPPSFSVSFDDNENEPGTPDSVIRHRIDDSQSPEVAEPEATIKTPGSYLKARRSITPADLQTMAATRRQVSGQVTVPPPIPERNENRLSIAEKELQGHNLSTLPTREKSAETLPTGETNNRTSSLLQLDMPQLTSDDGLGWGLEKEFDRVVEAQKVAFELSLQRLYHPFNGRFPSAEFPNSTTPKGDNPLKETPILPRPHGARPLPGDQTARGNAYPTDGISFANRSPNRQRGYLMRHNTKVVIASERAPDEPIPFAAVAVQSDLGPEVTNVVPDQVQVSPRKISQPTWTAEPWNGKPRRKSIRLGGDKSPVKRKPVDGAAPPLPGQASNVQEGLVAVVEDDLAEEEAEDFEDGSERGRLFVKVVGVKDLDLPLPQHERSQFALTLDNGLHCVTTSWLNLGTSAPIGQEFELVVLSDLEFQLTLQMKLEEPKADRSQSPPKPLASPTKKPGAFGRLFGSPKKKRELELKAQAEAQASQRPVTPPSAYEMVQGLVAKDGSFARAYVALSEHEKAAFGRPCTVDIVCFNEWAMEEVHIGSARSKKTATQLQKRPPYPIGKLELQLLYIPKPKGVKDEDMPKSMNGAMRELRDTEARLSQQPKEFEGILSQHGGDCPHWRRRFFKLAGSKLTAYHESTLQPRATINLAKASKLIDDKSILMQKETSTKGGGRRKSAFAEEEEGYMYVENGFRIRFANGEVIDFYADTSEHKEEWLKMLSQLVGKGPMGGNAPVKGWAELILKREKSTQAREGKTKSNAAERRDHVDVPASSIPSPTRAPPPRPNGHQRTESYQPQSASAHESRSQASSPTKQTKITKEERQKKTRSLMF